MKKRPNVLVVLADDLGQGDVSAFNPQAAWSTPYLDSLAAEGMRFTDSHATSSLCTPSRYSLLTGRYNWRSRLKASVLPGDSVSLLEHDRLTLPILLQEAGYRTAVVGKWHLGLDWTLLPEGDDPTGFGMSRQEYAAMTGDRDPRQRMGRRGNFESSDWPMVEGIDIDYSQPIRRGPREAGFEQSLITAASLDQPPFVYIDNGQPIATPRTIGGDEWLLDRRTARHQDRIQKGASVIGYDVTRVAQDFQDRALEILEDFLGGDEPWFLYVPSHLVHGPIIPDEAWRGRSGTGPYGDFVLQFDEYVGQLVSLIDAHGAAEETIVIVTSDNGASGVCDPANLLDEYGHDPSNSWRGIKSDIWEGGHRAPTIVRWTGTISPGTVSTQLVSHVDIFATVAEILGITLPDDAAEDSFSNLTAWHGDEDPVREALVSHSGGGGFAIRCGDWKLQLTTTGDGLDAQAAVAGGAAPTEYRPSFLYNLAIDPRERINLLPEYPELVTELADLLAQYVRSGRSTPGSPQSDSRSGREAWPQLAWMPDD